MCVCERESLCRRGTTPTTRLKADLRWQALRPLVKDSEDGIASWTATVATEWCRAVQDATSDASAATDPTRHKEGWHVFAEDSVGGGRPPDAPLHSAISYTPQMSHETVQRSHHAVQGLSPLHVMQAAWTSGAVSQSSPFPGVENVISVTFSANVPLGPAQVKQREV